MDVEHGSAGRAGASEEWGPVRSRSVSWYDPQVLVAGAVSRSGMEAMRAMRDGELPPPPVGRLVPGDLVHLEEGSVGFRCALDESMCNPMGLVAGGILCTMLDAALTCAVHTTLPQGVTHTSIELKVNFLRPVPLDSGPLDAVGTVIKPGRRIAFAEGEGDRPVGPHGRNGQHLDTADNGSPLRSSTSAGHSCAGRFPARCHEVAPRFWPSHPHETRRPSAAPC